MCIYCFLHSCSLSIQIIFLHLSTVNTVEGYIFYILFKNNLSVSQNIASNVKKTVNKEFSRMYKDPVVAYFKVIFAICLQELIKYTEDFVLDARRDFIIY